MSTFKAIQTPFNRVAQLLREFPFLWGVKQHWEADETIKVLVADATPSFNAYRLSHSWDNSWCWARVVTPTEEQLIRVEVGNGHGDMYDALDILFRKGVLKHVTHIVTHGGGSERVTIWRVLHPNGFREMYTDERRNLRHGGGRSA